MPSIILRRPALFAFGLALAASLLVALVDGTKPFYYDAGAYWGLSDSFVKDGTFSLTNFESPLRGYAYPLLNHVLQGTLGAAGMSDALIVKLFMAGIFATLAAVLLPRFAMALLPDVRIGFGARCALVAMLLLFWRGYISFPLSDFPALAAALLALYAVSRGASPPWALVAGLAAAVAVNVRPAYVLLVPAVLALFLAQWWSDSRVGPVPHRRHAAALVLLLAGLVAVSLPQSLATERHHGIRSPIPGAAADLSSFQLTVGLRLQRYETYVGTALPRPQLEYLDESTRSILASLPNGEVGGYGAYLQLAVDHPVVLAGVGFRHVVNGLDQRYPTPYAEELDTGQQKPLRLVGFTLIFLALLRVVWPAARRSLGRARWRYAVALLAACATSVPAAMETRFMLPAYALAYLLVAAPGWPALWRREGGRWSRRHVLQIAAIGAAYAVFMVVTSSVVSGATRQLLLG